MSKFATTNARPRPRAPIATTSERVLTHTGGLGFAPDEKSELVVLAAGLMSGELSYHESAGDRDARFRELVHSITRSEPGFIRRFAPYLRKDLRIRSAAIVLAAEYVAAGGKDGRQVVNSVLQRADEPAEMLGYWMGRYGRAIPAAIKRGTADAVRRLYNEHSVLKYGAGHNRSITMADVLSLVHPKPSLMKGRHYTAQSALFKHLIGRKNGFDKLSDEAVELLPVLAEDQRLKRIPENKRRDFIRNNPADSDRHLPLTWERLSSWLPGGMDAEAWEIAIPSMGVMALIRNLRNFEQAGISPDSKNYVATMISSASEVQRSRIFPYQIWSAYKHVADDFWKVPLGEAFAHSTANIPKMDATLVVVDGSGSMDAPVSGRSKIMRHEIAAAHAAAMAVNSRAVDVVAFAQTSKAIKVPLGESPLATCRRINDILRSHEIGWSTYGHTAIRNHFDPAKHRRVIVITDDQMHDAGTDLSNVPLIYYADVGGYRPRSDEMGRNGRYTVAGFSDSLFDVIHVLEKGRDADWPF